MLMQAEHQWPSLCTVAEEVLFKDEIEERWWMLLLAMTYLDQLQRLLNYHGDQFEAAALWEG